MKSRLPLFFLALWLTGFLPVTTVSAASRSQYYDWGPYYQPPRQVLGVTFSSSEGLPPPPLSPDLLPPPAAGILPGDFLAPAERLAETLQLTFTFNALAREQLRLQFAGERLAEAQTLIEQQRFRNATFAVTAYRDTMDTLASNMEKIAQTTSDQVTQLLQRVEAAAADHAVIAQTLAASAPPAVAETWTTAVNASEQALDAVADATGQPPIPDSLSTGIQGLKDQGLITPEASVKLYALDSRREVRDELDKLITSGQFPPAEAAKLNTAVAAHHPDIYQHQLDVLEFAELRSYQTLLPPSKETVAQITAWQADPGDLPPPPEIRPYLYYERARELAQTVDLTAFSTDQQAEVAQFYPDAAAQNPTFRAESDQALPGTAPSPSPSPSTAPPSPGGGGPYLTAPTGPLPGNPTYFLKRSRENLATAFTFVPARRSEWQMQLAEERLREANALAGETDRADDYTTALKDYARTITAAAATIDDINDRDTARALETQATRHNLVVEKGLLPPPADQPELVMMIIEATQDALDAGADALGRPALPPALSDRLQDLKAQGLILPEEVAVLTRAGTRNEVRDQIRQLEKEGALPPAEAKRMDEAQILAAPGDYNQLVEVRKIEELNRLRAIQAEFAQTASLRTITAGLEQRLQDLKNSVDPSLISPEDLAGNAKLLALYQQLVADQASPSATSQPPPLVTIAPSTLAPTSPFYFIDRAAEAIQIVTAFTAEAKEKVRLDLAQERLGEAYALLQRGQEERFRATLSEYTATMQTVYNHLGSGINLSDAAKASLGEQLAKQTAGDHLILQKVAVLASDTESVTTLSAATSVTLQGIDRAADLVDEPAIPAEVQARLDSLPPEALTDEQKTQLDQANTRLEARLAIGALVADGVLSPDDMAVLDQELTTVDPAAAAAVAQLRSLVELKQIQTQSTEIKDRVSENESLTQKLSQFQTTYTPGADIPAEIRPYIRLTRIEEVAKTIRPDIVRLEDFGNRKDIQLAVAALREEFRPTPELVRQVEAYRRGNPGRPLPPELARIEALSASLGVRTAAAACFLPSPPFAPNTPCPPPGAAIPFSTDYSSSGWPATPGFPAPTPTTGGEQLTYGQGPGATSPGVCPNGYHWMYDSGGWCMSNGGNYAASTPSLSPTGPGYTPYTPYSGTYTTGGSYSPPYYYGPAPTYYTTNPPPGTVPGTGPAPTAPGRCPSGYHWMYDSGGWCMADSSTYVPTGGTNYYPNYVNPPQSCSAGQSWSSAAGGCIPTGSTPGYYSPNLTRGSCGPGYYWDGIGCIAIYSGGYSGPTPSNSCQGFSCPSGYWLDYSACSCRPSGTSGGSTYSSPSTSGGSCQPPSGGCGPNSWYDYGSCSCRSSSTGTSTPTYSPPPSDSGSSSGSCPSGYHWMSDNGGWCMSDGAAPSSSSSSPPPSTPAPVPSSEPPPSEPAPAPPPSEPTPPPPSP